MNLHLILALFFLPDSSQAYIVAGSMGRDPQASMGQCLPGKKLSRNEALRAVNEQKITVVPFRSLTESELIALGTGLKQIGRLAGGSFPGVAEATFIYTNSSTVWNQSAGSIKINRNWSRETGMNSRNIGMLMHELGHYVGNNSRPDNPASYGKYFRNVPQPCRFSWYAGQSRREEFADVFATYLVNPGNLLRFGSKGCRDAYNYFRKKVFPKGTRLASCGSH